LGNRDTCLYTITFDDYVWAFKQSTLYRQYLWGGPSGHGPNRNEFLLRRTQQSSDPIRLVIVVANYTFGSSFFYCALHLKGEEVSGSTKWHVDCPFNANNDFHHLDYVNFFRPRITIFIVQHNVVKNVGMKQLPYGSSARSPLVSQGGLNWRKIFVLMANGGLNVTHLVL
jgi:hypothetical protein